MVNKKNYALTFRLQTKDGNILWEKPVRSEWILIPANRDIILIFGKTHLEGYFSLDKVMFEDVSIYDKNGQLIKEIDTEKIREGEIFSDGTLVLLGYDDLRTIDSSGNELWKIPTNAEKIRLSDNFIVTIEPISSPLGWKSIVYGKKGNVLGDFSETGSYWNMKILSDVDKLKILVGENEHVFTPV